MRRRTLLAAVAAATAGGFPGCTGGRSSGVEVLDRSLTDVGDGRATMRVRVENGGDRAHVEVRVDLAWTGDAGEVFESYSDVVRLDAGESRWVDVAIRHYPERASEYEHRVGASRTERPLARFDYEPTSAAAGDLVVLDAGRSRVVDGAIAAFDWTIGDVYAVGREVEYRLGDDADGVAVELRVTDTQGAFDTATRRIDPID